MSSLSARIDALEGKDSEWVIIRQCPACGQMVPNPESCHPQPCTLGLPHGDIPPPSPRDITLNRSYGLPDLPE